MALGFPFILVLVFPLLINTENVATKRELIQGFCRDVKTSVECSRHYYMENCDDMMIRSLCAWTCGYCAPERHLQGKNDGKLIRETRPGNKLEKRKVKETKQEQELILVKRQMKEMLKRLLRSKTNQPKCGRSSFSSSKVIGGTDASLGEFPWQAWLHVKNQGFACGGSLISPRWVLTAAHCIAAKAQPSDYNVTLGDVTRNKEEGSEQVFSVAEIKVHSGFQKPVPLNNDIALLKLSKPATLGSLVNTVCLPDLFEMVPTGTLCYITGWGVVKHPGEPSTILQQVQLPVVSSTLCQSRVHDNASVITPGMICAGDAGKTKASGCYGDSGGPFVCRNTAGQWVQQGVVSWGAQGCSSRDQYTVFARVSMYREWIEKNLKED